MKSLLLCTVAWAALIATAPVLPAQNLAGDEALSKTLIPGEDWELVAGGYQFTDALCADAAGSLYFTDVARGTNVIRVTPGGHIGSFLGDAKGVSGLKFGPDGRLYACQGPARRVIAIDVNSGTITVLATNVQPNDLVVSRAGNIYITETGKKQVTLITTQGVVRAVAQGINAPNGISLSPDQGTLAVSEYNGTNVWAFRVDADGGLSHGDRYMTLRAPADKPHVANGDGMTTDTQGRWYVTSAVGIQVFDATGRHSGVIARPQNKQVVSVAFAGPGLNYLHVACGDRIYRRKTQATGALFFLPAKQQ